MQDQTSFAANCQLEPPDCQLELRLVQMLLEMEAEEDNYTESFREKFSSTPATTCTIEESESVDLECVIAANVQTYIRCFSVDCSQSTTCTAMQESGTAVQELDTAVQESAAQETSSTDETWAEQDLRCSTQETEEGNTSTASNRSTPGAASKFS